MKRSVKNVYITLALLFACSILAILLQLFSFPIAVSYGVVVVLLAPLTWAISKFGFKKNKNLHHKESIKLTLSCLMAIFILLFPLGIFLSFIKTYASFNPLVILQGFIPTALTVVEIEILRYVVLGNKLKESRSDEIIFAIASAIIFVALSLNVARLATAEEIFVFISVIIFPTIAEEMLCNYLVRRTGFGSNLLFRFFSQCYLYIIPIIPDFGNFLYSVIMILTPFTIYYVHQRILPKDTEEFPVAKAKKIRLSFSTIPAVIALVILAVLVSGVTRYQLIAIASNSMIPTYASGDAVLLEKVDPENIEVGEILVFHRGGKIVTHRIVDKKSNTSFVTKGDANSTNDDELVKKDAVIGKVILVSKYIGYPSVWAQEIFNGR